MRGLGITELAMRGPLNGSGKNDSLEPVDRDKVRRRIELESFSDQKISNVYET